MRKYIYYLSLALATVFTLASCSKEEDKAVQQKEIKFSASVGTFQVKATDTGFEKGDAVGVYAIGTTSFENKKLVSDGTSLTPETPVYWSAFQQVKERNLFRAYYPYREDAPYLDGIVFTVNADQSTHAQYTASDFMMADGYASPEDGEVHLNFVHKMSKVVLTIDNRLGGEIADVFFGNVQGRAQFFENGGWNHLGDYGTIKAGKVTLNDGAPAWALILAPQDTRPQLIITTTDGKQYTYNSEYSVYFSSGRRYGVHIILDETSIATDFTSDVIDWVDDSDIQFGQTTSQSGEWAIIGDVMGSGWDTDFWMEKFGDNIYYSLLYYNEGESFKIRKDGNWDENFGISGSDGLYYHEAMAQGDNITLPSSGFYDVLFYGNEQAFYISPAEESNGWSLIGTLYGTAWDADFKTGYTHISYSGSDIIYPGLYIQIQYNAGEEFKFRFAEGWDLNFGSESGEIYAGSGASALRDGSNITIADGDGVYNIVLDWNSRYITVERVGDLPQEVYAENIAQVLGGNDNDIFTVSGYVTALQNTSYGNYYIADDTGTLYIYGTVNADGQYPRNANGWFTDEFGLISGDYVTVTGPKTTYGNTVELVDVKIVNVQKIPVGFYIGGAEASADGGTIYLQFRASGEPAITSSEWISTGTPEQIGDGWYQLSVEIRGNTSTDAREGTVTLTLDGSIAEATIYQKGYIPAVGDGSLENPFNAVAAVKYIGENLATGATSTESFYIKGVVSNIIESFGSKYGNATFYISETGSTDEVQFYAYRVLYYDLQKWADGNKNIQVGDEVVLYGQVADYRGTPETAAGKACVYSINGKTQENRVTIWEGAQYLEDWETDDRFFGDESAWIDAGIEIGSQINIYYYYDATDTTGDFIFNVFDGHWNLLSDNYGSQWQFSGSTPGTGIASFKVNAENYKLLTNTAGWGGALVIIGKTVTITKVELVQ